MKSINTGKDMWLRAQNANEEFKQNAPTQVVGGVQAMSVLTMTQLEAITQKKTRSIGGKVSELLTPHVSAESQATQHVAL